MKKIILTSLAAMFTTGAFASVSPYASLKVGYNGTTGTTEIDGLPKSEWDNRLGGYAGAIAVGAAFQADDIVGIRGELEYSYSQVEDKIMEESSEKSKITDSTILLGAYADFGGTQWSGFNPYVGLHAGYIMGTLKEYGTKDDIDGFAYGASLGVSYAIDGNFAVDFSGRYLLANRSIEFIDEGEKVKGDIPTDAYQIMLGARYAF